MEDIKAALVDEIAIVFINETGVLVINTNLVLRVPMETFKAGDGGGK